MKAHWLKGILLLAIGAGCAQGGGAAPSALSPVAIAVSPPIVRLQTGAGGSTRFKIAVTNVGPEAVSVRAMTRDLTLAPDGTPLVGARGKDPWSCAAWIDLQPLRLDLGPEAFQEVVCTLKVPRGVRGGRYAAVLFEALHLQRPVGSGLRVSARVGTVVMETVPRTGRPDGEVAALRATAREDGADISVDVRNTGNIDVKVTGSAVVFDAAGRVAGRVMLNGGTGTVLPGGIRTLTGRWTPLRPAPGSHLVEARIFIPRRGVVRGRTALVLSDTSAESEPEEVMPAG